MPEIETSTWMMICFIILLVASIWKIYAFLPNKALVDDDTTKESQEELINLVLEVIKKSDGNLTLNKLFDKIIDDKKFDSKHYWRFNQNRLNQLLHQYYLENKNLNSIDDIYSKLKA